MLDRLSRPTPAVAYLLLTLTTLFWAGNYTIGRWAAGHVPPVTLAFLRWTGAMALVLPLAVSHLKRDWPVVRANLGTLLVLGTLGGGLFNTLQYIALSETTATSAGIINSSSPVMIAILSFFLNGERVAPRQMAGIALSLTGVLVVIAKGDVESLAALSFNRGDLIMLGAMMLWALYTALLDKRPRLSFLSFAAVTYAVASGLNLPLAAAELAMGASIDPSLASLAAVAYIVVFPSFLAYLCYNRGIEIIGPVRGGVFIHLVPLFTVVLAVLFLGEDPAPYHAVGFALILTGVWLASGR